MARYYGVPLRNGLPLGLGSVLSLRKPGGAAAAVPDPYFEYTTLLLPGNGTNGAQNNTFLDSSTNNFTITRNGNTTQGTFSPFSQTGWGNYFDGTGDYLASPANSALALGTGDFTLECWVYATSTPSDVGIYEGRSNGNAGTVDGFTLTAFSGSVIRIYSNATLIASSGTSYVNAWCHVAVVRASGTWTLYINGVSQGTSTTSRDLTNNDALIGAGRYGATGAATAYFPGYISNFRIVKGTAVYTSNFTPSTTPLTAISGTSLLTCQSNRFIDNSTNAFALTRSGDVSVQAFSPFNPTAAWSASTYGGSGYFDGSGDYLTAPNNSATDLGAGDFTVEAWIYTNSTNAYQGIIQKYFGPGAYNGWSFRFDNTGKIQFYCADGSSSEFTLTGTSTCNNNAWHHVAAVRSGSTVAIYVDGARENTGTCAFTISSTSSVYIGQHFNGAFIYTGYIAALRVVKGSAVYSGTTYTVPTAPPTAITNTSLLLNFTNAGIYDATSKNDLETVGNAQISTTQSKFGGSSMLFDGSGDYLKSIGPATPSQYVGFGTGDFTIEAWLYITSSTVANNGIYDARYSASATGPLIYYIPTSGMFMFYNGSNAISGGTITINTWTHVALVRYNGVTKLYLNGTQSGSNYTDTNNYTSGVNSCFVGAFYDGTASWNGYIDDFRVTRGIARYTSDFTPPTAAFPLL